MRFIWFAVLPVFLLASGEALSQPCRVDLHPADDNFGYRYRSPPDRCESLYSAPVVRRTGIVKLAICH